MHRARLLVLLALPISVLLFPSSSWAGVNFVTSPTSLAATDSVNWSAAGLTCFPKTQGGLYVGIEAVPGQLGCGGVSLNPQCPLATFPQLFCFYGNFLPGDSVFWMFGSRTVTFTFGPPPNFGASVSGFGTHLTGAGSAQWILGAAVPFTIVMQAFNGTTLLGTFSTSGLYTLNPDGSVPFLGVSSTTANITSVTMTVTGGPWDPVLDFGTVAFDSLLVRTGSLAPALQVNSGDDQTGQPSHPLTNPLVVKVVDQSGSAVNNVQVRFQITAQPSGAQGASLSVASASTQNGRASTQLTLGDQPGRYQVTVSCSTCTPTSVTFTERTPMINVDVSMSAFIQSETVDGPGTLYAPIANAAPLVQQLSYGLLGAASGITCGAPPLYGIDLEALRFSGNNRSFDPAGTSYKIKEKWTLNSDDSLYPTGLVGSPSQLTVPSRSWAPNSFSGGFLTPQAKAATTLSSPRCNLLFAQALPNLSLTPLPTVTRTATTITSHFQVQVGDPLVFNSNKISSFVPNLLDYASPLRANLTLMIDLTTNTFELSGTHTCYPAFELYLNNSPIYTFTPTSDSFVTIAACLALRAFPINVDIFGQVPMP